MRKSFWKNVIGNAQNLEDAHGYIPLSSSLTTFTLPTTYNIGDNYIISGSGGGGWAVAQNANQSIIVGNISSTIGITGGISSTQQQDVVTIVCVGLNQFKVINCFGNITVT